MPKAKVMQPFAGLEPGSVHELPESTIRRFPKHLEPVADESEPAAEPGPEEKPKRRRKKVEAAAVEPDVETSSLEFGDGDHGDENDGD